MNSDQLFQALEDHFESLNKIVCDHLAEAVLAHQETARSFTVLTGGPGAGADENKKNLQKHLATHRANLEVCQSKFTALADHTPITAMLSEVQKEYWELLEKIPVRVTFDDSQGSSQARARHIYRQFLLPDYMQRLFELIRETRKEIARSMNMLVKNEPGPVPEIRWEARYDTLLVHFFKEEREVFEEQLKQSGKALSLKGWKIRSHRGSSAHGFALMQQAERSWRTTFYALYEDLRFRELLFAFIQEVMLLRLEVNEIISGRIRATLYPELEKQKLITQRILDQLPDPEEADMEALKSYLVKELYMLNKEKKMESQENSTLEAAEGIPQILQKMESMLLEQLEDFPPRVGVVRAPDYEAGIKASEISYFSPREFLEFSSLAKFLQVHKGLQTDLSKVLDRIIREFREFDQIIDFYLDSAIALTQKPGMQEEEVVMTFREGIKRLEGITGRSKAMLTTLEQEKWSQIAVNTDSFIDSVKQLDDNDNFIAIYTRLLKSKALAASAQNRKRLVSGLKTSSERVSGFTATHFKWLRSSYEDIRKRLKLDASSASLTPEISNYLAGVRRRITQLPVIYQHLFESAPVRELNLFLKREEETARLDHSLADWEKGNYGATLVHGEAGSGCSSLLQHYSRSLKSQYPILSFQVDRFYSHPEDFHALVREIFDQDPHEQFISGLTEKIVIVDGLERLFTRTVNGFECLRRFLAFMVNSSEKIFWICSVSKLAFHYLNSTVALSDHFDYILDIDNLKGSDMREIIMKRNRLSGYPVRFLGPQEESKDEGAQGQDELEEIFFTDLEKAAGSNIRLSLIYWLQSVQSVGDDGIIVGPFSVPDLDFLENLTARKAFALLLVVMHGKISEEYHALASHSSLEESSGLLAILKEDSVLVRQGDYFYLNGILYRHVVRLLKDRNLIH